MAEVSKHHLVVEKDLNGELVSRGTRMLNEGSKVDNGQDCKTVKKTPHCPCSNMLCSTSTL